MARSVTVQVIVDGARFLADDANGKLASTSAMVTFTDLLWARLYSFYLAAEPDRFRTEATITSDGTATYTLPTDWFSTIGIDFFFGTSNVCELERLQETERNMFVGQGSGQSRKYRLGATTIVLFPTPVLGQTYRHIYLPTAPALTVVGSTIDCRMGHEEYLQLCLARKLLQKEEAYDGRWDRQIDKIETELKSEANLRYLNDMVTMVHRQTERDRPFWSRGGLYG